jgi:hypothetical protein
MRVSFLQPVYNWFRLTTKDSTSFLINSIKSIFRAAIVCPFKDGFFLNSIFIVDWS